MINRHLQMNERQKIPRQNYKIINEPSLKKDSNPPKVTVITPVYNAETYLRRTLDSVINQTLGIENMEYILVDDCSRDGSKDILLEYASKFPNIIVVFLQRNTGTPGYPRNIGIGLASAKYITFLDADDWLEPSGLESLYKILEETDDDYVVGKTIQIQEKGTKIVGEHESCKERRSVSPFSIPHMFQHLGPRARMCRADLIKNNHLLFPEMKFAEDKQFFIDVLTHCHRVSTTKATIYYLNRSGNNNRLTNQTNIIQKTNSNLQVIYYIIQKKLEIEKEKMILNRLYEFDCISRFFNTPHFQGTKLKWIYYYKFRQVVKTTKWLHYDFSDNFFEPFHKVVYELFCKRRYKDLEKLFKWNKEEKVKKVVIKDNYPYILVPFLENEFKYIGTPMYAVAQKEIIKDDMYYLYFKVYGLYISSIMDVLIRDTKDAQIETVLDVTIDEEGNGILAISFKFLKQLPPSIYSIFLRYNDYLKVNIRKNDKDEINCGYQNRDYIFFNTVYANVGLKIK